MDGRDSLSAAWGLPPITAAEREAYRLKVERQVIEDQVRAQRRVTLYERDAQRKVGDLWPHACLLSAAMGISKKTALVCILGPRRKTLQDSILFRVAEDDAFLAECPVPSSYNLADFVRVCDLLGEDLGIPGTPMDSKAAQDLLHSLRDKVTIAGDLDLLSWGELFQVDFVAGNDLPVYDIYGKNSVWTGGGGVLSRGGDRCHLFSYSSDEISGLLREAFHLVQKVEHARELQGDMWEPVVGFESILPCGYNLACNRDFAESNVLMIDGNNGYGFILNLDWLALIRRAG